MVGCGVVVVNAEWRGGAMRPEPRYFSKDMVKKEVRKKERKKEEEEKNRLCVLTLFSTPPTWWRPRVQ